MSSDFTKLKEQLRTYYGDDLPCRELLMDARHAIEALEGEIAALKMSNDLFVEDLRIKLANRELEILDWKEAVEIANAENDDLRREVAATTKHAQLLNKMLGEAEARAERLRVALEKARHELVTTDGLYATDIHPENRPALIANGAQIEWRINSSPTLAIIDKALEDDK